MDEEDEQWVKRQRMAYHNGTGGRPDTPCPQLNLSNLDSFVLDKGSQLVGVLILGLNSAQHSIWDSVLFNERVPL